MQHTFTLSASEVAEAVSEWSTKRGFIENPARAKVSVRAVARTAGYGMSEHTEHVVVVEVTEGE